MNFGNNNGPPSGFGKTLSGGQGFTNTGAGFFGTAPAATASAGNPVSANRGGINLIRGGGRGRGGSTQ